MKKRLLMQIILCILLLIPIVYGSASYVINAPADLYESTSSSNVFNWTPTMTVDTTTESSVYLNDVLNTTVDCTNATACNTTITGMNDGFYQWYIRSRDSATNATVTGTESESFDTSSNYILNITYTVDGSAETCSADFTKNATLSVTEAMANLTADCNLSASNSSGSLKLTTQNKGSDEYINITGGNSTSIFGFTVGITYGSEDFYSSETRWMEIRDSHNQTYFRWGNITDNVMLLNRDTGDLNITGSFNAAGTSGSIAWSNLDTFPAACPSGSYITQLNDSVTCTAIGSGNLDMNNNNIINVSTIYMGNANKAIFEGVGNGNYFTFYNQAALTRYLRIGTDANHNYLSATMHAASKYFEILTTSYDTPIHLSPNGVGKLIINSDTNQTNHDLYGVDDLYVSSLHGGSDINLESNLDGTGFDLTIENINATGNITGNQIYGEMWYHNHTATSLNFAVDGTYYNLTFDNSLVNGFIFNDTGDYLEADYAGKYKACYMASGDGQDNHIYYTSITINGVVEDKCEAHKKITAGGDILTMNGCCFVSLSVGDEVKVATADVGGTGAGNYYSSNLNLVRIGE